MGRLAIISRNVLDQTLVRDRKCMEPLVNKLGMEGRGREAVHEAIESHDQSLFKFGIGWKEGHTIEIQVFCC